MPRPFLLLTLLAAACSADAAVGPQVITSNDVSAVVEGDRLVIRNRGGEALRTGVVESRTLDEALAQWCFGSAQCGDALAAGQALTVRLAAIPGYSANAESVTVVYWEPTDERSGPTRVGRLVVPLP
jgi:hypothetical protein